MAGSDVDFSWAVGGGEQLRALQPAIFGGLSFAAEPPGSSGWSKMRSAQYGHPSRSAGSPGSSGCSDSVDMCSRCPSSVISHFSSLRSQEETSVSSEYTHPSSALPKAMRHNVCGFKQKSKRNPKEQTMLMTDRAHNDMLRESVFQASSQQLARAEQYMAERASRKQEQDDWSSSRFSHLRNLAHMHDRWVKGKRKSKSKEAKYHDDAKQSPPGPWARGPYGDYVVHGISPTGVPCTKPSDYVSEEVASQTSQSLASARPRPKWSWEQAKRIVNEASRARSLPSGSDGPCSECPGSDHGGTHMAYSRAKQPAHVGLTPSEISIMNWRPPASQVSSTQPSSSGRSAVQTVGVVSGSQATSSLGSSARQTSNFSGPSHVTKPPSNSGRSSSVGRSCRRPSSARGPANFNSSSRAPEPPSRAGPSSSAGIDCSRPSSARQAPNVSLTASDITIMNWHSPSSRVGPEHASQLDPGQSATQVQAANVDFTPSEISILNWRPPSSAAALSEVPKNSCSGCSNGSEGVQRARPQSAGGQRVPGQRIPISAMQQTAGIGFTPSEISIMNWRP